MSEGRQHGTHRPQPEMIDFRFGKRLGQSCQRDLAQIGIHVEGMRERIRLLEAVIQNFPGGISVFDSDFKMVLCNQQQKACWNIPRSFLPKGFHHLKVCSASMPGAANTDQATSRNMFPAE